MRLCNIAILLGFLVSIVALMGLAGCAPDVVLIPHEQAAQVGPEEGIVFGSVRIRVDPSLPDTSPAFAPARRTEGMTHSLIIDCTTFIPLKGTKKTLSLKLGEEQMLVQRLPAGRCAIVHWASGGILLPMAAQVGFLQVQGGRTTHFGAFDVFAPTEIAGGATSQGAVREDKMRTVGVLQAEYGTLFDQAEFNPMVPLPGLYLGQRR